MYVSAKPLDVSMWRQYDLAHAMKGEWRSFTFGEVCLQGQKSGLFIEEGSASVCFSQLDNSRLTMERLHVWRFFFACAKKEEILNIQQPLHCYLLPWLIEGPLLPA